MSEKPKSPIAIELPEQDKARMEQEAAETMESFKKRVEERTGVSFDEITEGIPDDLLGGQILVRGTGEADGWVVVTHGYPEKDPGTDEEVYNDFRRVNTKTQ